MGKLSTAVDDVDRATKVWAGARNSAGVTDWMNLKGLANLALWGNFVGQVVLERSFDGGATALVCTALGAEVVFTGPATEVLDEPESGVLFRLNFRQRTSGTLNWRISR